MAAQHAPDCASRKSKALRRLCTRSELKPANGLGSLRLKPFIGLAEVPAADKGRGTAQGR